MVDDKVIFKERDLVMLRIPSFYGWANTWWRVMFIDTNETFIGRLEKHGERNKIDYEKGKDYRLDNEQVKEVFKEVMQWCYSYETLICECNGLCREK